MFSGVGEICELNEKSDAVKQWIDNGYFVVIDTRKQEDAGLIVAVVFMIASCILLVAYVLAMIMGTI